MNAKYWVPAAMVLALAELACGTERATRKVRDAGADRPFGSSDGSVLSDEPGVERPGGGSDIDGGATGPRCTVCHGSASNAAPPSDPSGNSATTAAGVGAHQQHLGASAWHAEIACAECHLVPSKASYDPTVPTHLNGKDDLVWGKLAGAGSSFDAKTLTCAGTYCHGTTLLAAAAGGTVKRTPVWNQVDGSWDACGTTCHTNPPGGTHAASTACETCHSAVVASYTPGNPPVVTWKNASLHINGKVDVTTSGTVTCTTCHGDATVGPAPPKGTKGQTLTTQAAVGAHAQHLSASTWHRAGTCADCHATPTSTSHSNGVVDFTWGAPSNADSATPAYNATSFACSNVYCHGTTLLAAATGGTVKRTPVWNQVDGSWDACGTTCHTNPPGGTHAASTACATCHSAVVASYTPGNPPVVTWKNASLHINGKVDVTTGGALTCTTCHGDATLGPAPPKGTKGQTLTTQAAVGAHAQHLSASTWHRTGTCADCHAMPTSTSHSNSVVDFSWGAPSNADSATPAYDTTSFACSNVYCHGTTLLAAATGGTVKRTPVWNQVDGSWDACGTTCHTNPPGGTHAASTACATCHSTVVASYTPGNPPVVTWKNASLHINGKVDLTTGGGATCTTCHGDAAVGPAPPKGTNGETLTTQAAVGAHAQHLSTSTWHRAGTCADCHATPTSTSHSNSVVDFTWGAPSNADSATPAYNATSFACSNVYCHGTTLLAAATGGTVKRTPVWNQVDGSWDACGTTCHTNPPGESHVNATTCANCHPMVITSYTASTPPAATWANPNLHINGSVELTGGTTVNCTSCHGDPINGPAPPRGVSGETATTTLAVGRHAAHLTAGTTHVAFACATCHAVPVNGDTTHAAQYVASASLDTPGHHGDLAFSGVATGMTWDVSATQGAPVTARGTCIGTCHSNGRGGPPAVTPYWAGGTWTKGSCATCHAARPNNGRHGAHAGEGPCTMCHPGANTATHSNGTRDILVTALGPDGGFVTLSRPSAVACASGVSCSGTCHGVTHNNRCW